jgi:Kef-type K+ transport system membrane component KefB
MNAESISSVLILLGSVFLASLAADIVGRRTRLPRVTLLISLGVCVGPAGFDLIPDWGEFWYPFIADLALVMVAFLLGGELTSKLLRAHGREVLIASLLVVAATAAVVATGLSLLGWPPAMALLLGAISTSTDPAAVSDVVKEVRAKGPFTKTLLGIVAVDDAWGIIALSLALTLVLGLGSAGAGQSAALEGLVHLVGAVGVGCALGIPMAYLSGRIRSGDPTQAEALGGVLLCGGISLLLGVPYLLSAMVMGVVVANTARHHRRPFRAIEGIEWPFMVLFFVLSGASLRIAALSEAALLIAAYVVLRLLGRLAGGWLGTRLSGQGMPAGQLGISLLPQAGVAMGMALVASERLPEFGPAILTATVGGTVFFELVGPVLTRQALIRNGEGEQS